MNRRLYLGAAVLLCATAAGGIVALVVADSEYLLEINLVYTAVGAAAVWLRLRRPGSRRRARSRGSGWLCAAVAVAAFGFSMVRYVVRPTSSETASETLQSWAEASPSSRSRSPGGVPAESRRRPRDRVVIGLVLITLARDARCRDAADRRPGRQHGRRESSSASWRSSPCLGARRGADPNRPRTPPPRVTSAASPAGRTGRTCRSSRCCPRGRGR